MEEAVQEATDIVDDQQDETLVDHKAEVETGFTYLWSNRFELHKGELITTKTALESTRSQFVNKSKAENTLLAELGANSTQRWINLGMMKAYMDVGSDKMNICKPSPSLSVSFGLEGKRKFTQDLFTNTLDIIEISIADILSNIDIKSDTKDFQNIQEDRQMIGLYGAIAEAVINKHQRKFCDIA